MHRNVIAGNGKKTRRATDGRNLNHKKINLKFVPLLLEKRTDITYSLPFLDLFSPSPLIQNIPTTVINSAGQEENIDYKKNTAAYNRKVINSNSGKTENLPYIWYSEVQLTWYKDNAGGVQEIIQK